MLVTQHTVELCDELELAVDEVGDLSPLPIQQDVRLVPLIYVIRDANELLCVYFEGFLVAQSVEDGRDESALLLVTLREGQIQLAGSCRTAPIIIAQKSRGCLRLHHLLVQS